MNKQELIKELKEFKKSIQDFHHKRWNYTVNIPMDLLQDKIKNNPEYQKHDLENNVTLRNAIYGVENNKLSKERKKEVYEIDKSNLKQQYGKLTQYIQLFSGNPAINKFPCYDGYFLNDGYQGEEANFASVISDIDIMIGKIDTLDEKNFKKILKGNDKNFWRDLHPIWWIYWIFTKLRKYWIVSFLMTILVGILWIFIEASLSPFANSITKPIQDYICTSFNNKTLCLSGSGNQNPQNTR